MWPFKKRERRAVVLKTITRTVAVWAYRCDSGWYASWNGDTYILNPDGSIIGPPGDVGWYPLFGWGEDEDTGEAG